MTELNREQLHRLARLGAEARLEELRREEAAIRAAFPELFGRRRGRPARQAHGADGAQPGRRKSHMSTAARKAQSERMKKYWADRRKAKGAK